jgi:hypothetical protein
VVVTSTQGSAHGIYSLDNSGAFTTTANAFGMKVTTFSGYSPIGIGGDLAATSTEGGFGHCFR